MPVERSEITFLLSKMALFRGCTPTQVSWVADAARIYTLEKGQLLYEQGAEADSFYIVFSGRIRVARQFEGREEFLGMFVDGDHFGEEALLLQRPRQFSATAVETTWLLVLTYEQFRMMVSEYSVVRRKLLSSVSSRQMARRKRVAWLGEGETIYLFSRKDRAYLYISLVPPLLVGWLGIFLAYGSGTWLDGTFATVGEYAGIGILVISLLWGVWDWLDWTNDYYIITSERVIWLERVIAFYESRQEAPIDTVLTVGTNTDLLGRILGYGDVRVKTFTGQIVMRHAGNPNYLLALIEELVGRIKRQKHRSETDALERAIRVRLGLQVDPVPERRPTVDDTPQAPHRGENPFRFLIDIFKVRIEEEGMVTYRRHWLLLVKKVSLPTLLMLVMVAFMGARFIYNLPIATPLGFVGGWFALLLLPSLWWLYEYVDWRNDIYQVTEEHIVDVYKKPLGEVDKKTAPLENILSIHHEQTGLIRVILNYGDVVAMVGAARFTFDGVYNPAEVVQDIFLRMNARKRRLQETEAARERDRVADWLAAYHRQINGPQNLENLNNSDPNSV